MPADQDDFDADVLIEVAVVDHPLGHRVRSLFPRDLRASTGSVAGIGSVHRLSLGQVLTQQRYLLTVDRSGRAILEPAVVMTRTDERLLADPAFRNAMTAAALEPTEPLDLDSI